MKSSETGKMHFHFGNSSSLVHLLLQSLENIGFKIKKKKNTKKQSNWIISGMLLY